MATEVIELGYLEVILIPEFLVVNGRTVSLSCICSEDE